jgi:hypothetical protein
VRRFRFWLRRLWVLCFLTVQIFFIVKIGLDLVGLELQLADLYRIRFPSITPWHPFPSFAPFPSIASWHS